MLAEIMLFLAEISWLSVVIVIGGCAGIAGLLNDEEPAAATALLACVLAGLSGVFVWNHSFAELEAMIVSWKDYLPWVGAYLAAGAAWSVIKWATYIRNAAIGLKETVAKVKSEWERKLDGTRTMYEKYVSELASAVNKHCMYISENNIYATDLLHEDQSQLTTAVIIRKLKFTASRKKGLITAWIAYWPISICSVFLQEFVVGIVNNIFSVMRGVYNKVSDLIFAHAIEGVLEETQAAASVNPAKPGKVKEAV